MNFRKYDYWEVRSMMSKVRLLRVRLLEVRELSAESTRIIFFQSTILICWQYDNYSQKILTVSFMGKYKRDIFFFIYLFFLLTILIL